jgi:hypothetical protein
MERLELDAGDGDSASRGLVALNAATYYVSLSLQVVGLVLAIVALATASDAVPAVILWLLCLDLSVQAIELAWYTIARLALGSAGAVADRLWLRYGGWALSVPTMVTSLFQYMLYRADRCGVTRVADVFEPLHIAAIALMTLAVWDMLFVGYIAYEFPGALAERLDAALRREGSSKAWAWVSLAAMFVPHLVVVARSGDGLSWFALLWTAGFFALYGAAALVWDGDDRDALLKRNSAYSVLDLMTKNTLGAIFSIAVLTWDSDDAPAC